MATTHPSTGREARERSRLASSPEPHLIAPGGPVGAAIRAGRGEVIEADRGWLSASAAAIRIGLARDAARIDRCLAAAVARNLLDADAAFVGATVAQIAHTHP